jgi:pimeloyl-ACP methyl ester carboxylesterase
MNIQPFHVRISQEILDDLRARLGRTRWPDEVSGACWDYGTNLSYMQELVGYWQTEFDWRAQEEALNRFAHFQADIDGLNIHFLHERGKGPDPIPLIITHGWPGSFFQMVKIIPLLTDPANHGDDAADSFDVVVPSLPGYGFSDRPTTKGLTPFADLWARLMQALGYRRFAAHGGDLGSGVTQMLGLDYADRLIGLHLTDVPYWSSSRAVSPDDLSEPERKYMEAGQKWAQEEGAYGMIQSTRPQTLAYGLNDSPAGLAAWIVEKFRAWSDCDGEVERRFTKDELLTNLTIYWATETINSSFRVYYEGQHSPLPPNITKRIEVPTAVAQFPKDLVLAPREWAERFFNVQRWTLMPRGGHFAAMEEPELLVEDIRAFFRDKRGKQ